MTNKEEKHDLKSAGSAQQAIMQEENHDHTHELSPLVAEAAYNLPRLYFSIFSLRIAFGVVTLLLPIYLFDMTSRGLADFTGIDIGLIVGSVFIGEIALITIFGRLSDIVRRRSPFIIGGNLVAAVSFAMLSIFTSFEGLFIAHLVEGIGAAMAIGPTLALIGDSATPEEHGEKMGLFETFTFGGMAAGFFVGGTLYAFLGEVDGQGRWTFAIASVMLLLGAFAAWQIHEPEQDHIPLTGRNLLRFYRETVPHKAFLGFPLVLYLITVTASTLTLIFGANTTFTDIIFLNNIERQYAIILIGSAIFLFILGLIDFYFEITMDSEEKAPLDGSSEVQSHVEELSEAFENPELRKILPAWLFVMIILGTIITFLPIILRTGVDPSIESLSTDEVISHATDAEEIGLFFVFGGAILGISQYFFGRIVDKVGRRPILILGVASLLFLAIEVLFVITFRPEWFENTFEGPGLYFVILASVTGIGVAAFGPAALAVLADNSDETNRGTAAGVYSLLLGIGHIIGDLLGGIIYDVGREVNGNQGGAIGIFFFIFINATIAFILVLKIDSSTDGSKQSSYEDNTIESLA